MRITIIPSDGVRAEIALENDELGDAPYVRCGPDGTVELEFGDDIDLTDLRDALLKEYPLDKISTRGGRMMDKAERNAIWRESVERFGTRLQSVVCMEECSELIQAVSKRLRGKPDPDDNLAEEMADVVICLHLLQDMYGVTDERLESWIERKTKRQMERNKA